MILINQQYDDFHVVIVIVNRIFAGRFAVDKKTNPKHEKEYHSFIFQIDRLLELLLNPNRNKIDQNNYKFETLI